MERQKDPDIALKLGSGPDGVTAGKERRHKPQIDKAGGEVPREFRARTQSLLPSLYPNMIPGLPILRDLEEDDRSP
jgi:hypothetical protein